MDCFHCSIICLLRCQSPSKVFFVEPIQKIFHRQGDQTRLRGDVWCSRRWERMEVLQLKNNKITCNQVWSQLFGRIFDEAGPVSRNMEISVKPVKPHCWVSIVSTVSLRLYRKTGCFQWWFQAPTSSNLRNVCLWTRKPAWNWRACWKRRSWKTEKKPEKPDVLGLWWQFSGSSLDLGTIHLTCYCTFSGMSFSW